MKQSISLQPGFSLIEVLVTLLVTTIGVLGMVALQGRSIQYTQDAAQRNAAVELANEYVELMRSAPQLIYQRRPPAFPMNAGLVGTSSLYKEGGKVFDDEEDCVAIDGKVPTSIKQLRDCWIERAIQRLPGGEDVFTDYSYICRSTTPGTCSTSQGAMVEIRLAWRVPDGGCLDANSPSSSICTYTLRVQP